MDDGNVTVMMGKLSTSKRCETTIVSVNKIFPGLRGVGVGSVGPANDCKVKVVPKTGKPLGTVIVPPKPDTGGKLITVPAVGKGMVVGADDGTGVLIATLWPKEPIAIPGLGVSVPPPQAARNTTAVEMHDAIDVTARR